MLIEILYIVFWVLGLIGLPWPGSPVAGWPWAWPAWVLLMFALAGIALFGNHAALLR